MKGRKSRREGVEEPRERKEFWYLENSRAEVTTVMAPARKNNFSWFVAALSFFFLFYPLIIYFLITMKISVGGSSRGFRCPTKRVNFFFLLLLTPNVPETAHWGSKNWNFYFIRIFLFFVSWAFYFFCCCCCFFFNLYRHETIIL